MQTVDVFIRRIGQWSFLARVVPSTGYLLYDLHSRHLPDIPCTTSQAERDIKSNVTHFRTCSQRFIDLIDVITSKMLIEESYDIFVIENNSFK